MTIIDTAQLNDAQKQAVRHLWNTEYPASLSYNTLGNLDDYLNALSGKKHYLLMDGAEIAGWLFLFLRDGAQWFAIILDSRIHGHGYGTQMLNIAKTQAASLQGWVTDHDNDLKADGLPYHSPLAFYLKNGFVLHPGQRLETDKLSAVMISWSAP